MRLNTNSSIPIYQQIAEWIETEILQGELNKDEKVYSQYQLAEMFNINPATAAKGLNLLADEDILYKKRGLGMFVSTSALEIIRKKRKNVTLKKLIEDVVLEANRLHLEKGDIIEMIENEFEGKGGGKE